MQASRWAPQNDEDAFAQTREPDNFFDDDITPVSEPIVQPLPAAEQSQRQFNQQGRGRGYNRGRGRGRGGGSETPRRQDSLTPQDNGAKETTGPTVATTTKEPGNHSTEELTELKTQEPEDTAAAETSTEPSATKVQAVRGPRHQTGGVQRPKLTEDELSARMAAAALNNAKREAAHREAEADAAKFEAREAAAKQRRVQETALRRVMDTERERNRQRKLGAQGVREWDQGKDEGQSMSSQSRRGYHPGVHGGVVRVYRGEGQLNETTDTANNNSTNGNGRGRGRGGRGIGQRGRGENRGGINNGTPNTSQNDAAAPSLGEDHFPALASNTKAPSSTQQSSASLISPITDKGTWADQVEAGQ